jgi:hypothetical protein
MLEFKSEYSAKEWAEIFGISKRTFMKLISEAKIEKSSEVDGVPQYKQGDVIKYIVLEEKLPLYINFVLYFAGNRGMSVGDLHEGFLYDYKFYSHQEYRNRFGEDASEKIRMKIYDILRVREWRGSVVRVVRDKKPVYVLPMYATPEQKKEHEDRRNALKVMFLCNPVTNSIKSSISPKKELTDDEVKILQMIRAYVDALLWLNETSHQNGSKQ